MNQHKGAFQDLLDQCRGLYPYEWDPGWLLLQSFPIWGRMPRERAEPGPLVILNNALAGSLLLVTDCRADGRIRNRQALNIKSNHRPLKTIYGPSSLREDRGPRGIFLPRTLATSWHRFVIKTNAKVNNLTFLMFHIKFRNGEFSRFMNCNPRNENYLLN